MRYAKGLVYIEKKTEEKKFEKKSWRKSKGKVKKKKKSKEGKGRRKSNGEGGIMRISRDKENGG